MFIRIDDNLEQVVNSLYILEFVNMDFESHAYDEFT